MCDLLTVKAKVRTLAPRWVYGYKNIFTDEHCNCYATCILDYQYRVTKLDNALLLSETSFEEHVRQVSICPADIRFSTYAPPGFYVAYRRKDADDPCDFGSIWLCAAHETWIRFASDNCFTAHMLLCAKTLPRLHLALEQYQANMGKILSLSWHYTNKPQTPIHGYGHTIEIARGKAIDALMKWRPLSYAELDTLREAPVKQPPNLKPPCYAEIRSPLWEPVKK